MAATCLRSAKLLSSRISSCGTIGFKPQIDNFIGITNQSKIGYVGVLYQVLSVRHGSFFNKKSAESVWDSVTSVSNQGRKRGRASRGKLMRKENFNRGQKIGFGRAGMDFPGLTSPVLKGKSEFSGPRFNVRVSERPAKLAKKAAGSKRMSPLQRGYSGRRMPGRQVGPPEDIEDYLFEGFKTVVIENKIVGNITASQGTVMRSSILVVTGNGNGLAGFAYAKAADPVAALRSAKKKAAQRLIYIDRCEDRTLWHNFHEQYHRTKVTAFRKYDGYGLICHRVIKSICDVVGIKDLYVKTDGRTKNVLSITRAFFGGLYKQNTHQEMADRLGHHIVECKPATFNYPEVKASPSPNANTNFKKDFEFDFDTYFFDGRPPMIRKKKMFFENFHSHKKKKFTNYKFRNQMDAKQQRILLGIDGKVKNDQ